MRRVVVWAVVGLSVLSGCLQGTDPGGAGDAGVGDGEGATYRVEGCRLFEAIVPGDLRATDAALPAGFDPVDYGTYWGGPAVDRSAVSVVWWDCPVYRQADREMSHREVYLGAYVEVPKQMETDATPFYLFDVVAPPGPYRDALSELGWEARAAEEITLAVEAGGRVEAEVWTRDGGLSGRGAFPAGDQRTGRFAFVNYHEAPRGLLAQRLAFEDFPYRTAPVELTVDGIEPLAELLEGETVRGTGFSAREVAYDASVAPVR